MAMSSTAIRRFVAIDRFHPVGKRGRDLDVDVAVLNPAKAVRPGFRTTARYPKATDRVGRLIGELRSCHVREFTCMLSRATVDARTSPRANTSRGARAVV